MNTLFLKGDSVVPRICFQSSGVVGVIKPYGLPTQAPHGIHSVEQWLRSTLPHDSYVGVPHRLDRAVSGVMLFANTPRAARQLSRQFERRQIEKTYLAMTEVSSRDEGALEGSEACFSNQNWHDWIAKIPNESQACISSSDERSAREAHTRSTQLGFLPGPGERTVALLWLQPQTGRMHQLRVQSAARGMPIIGDILYGAQYDLMSDPQWDFWGRSEMPREAPIALHAWKITFHDPDTKQLRTVEAEIPSYWPAEAHRLIQQNY